MNKCGKYGKLDNRVDAVKKIDDFCFTLKANRVKDSKEAFLKLPLVIQCLFLYYAWQIFLSKNKYSADSYRTSFLLFKLFRDKNMAKQRVYKPYIKLKTLESKYKVALEWYRKQPKTKSRAPRKNYDKDFQKYATPTDPLDPLLLYYTSLYEQNSKSKLAISWLTEHGVFEGEERNKLIKKWKKLNTR